MKRTITRSGAAAFVAALVFALSGCGGGSTQHTTSHAVTNPNTPAKVTLASGKPGLHFAEPNGSTCVTRDPPAANECIEEYYSTEGTLGRAVTPLSTVVAPKPKVSISSHQQCADWSVYQGYYPRTTGLSCVIVQAAYGGNREPSVSSQISDLKAHGIPYGAYNFGEPGVSGGYEFRRTKELAPNAPLGYWFDAEVSGVFWRSCEFTSEAAAYHTHVYGVFSYPGGYVAGGGGHCQGYLWASEWGVGGPYAFGGYPSSAIVLWQYCGTCFRYGVEIDLDQDRGLIALGNPPKPKPKPTPAQIKTKEKHQLNQDYKLRTELRVLEGNPPKGHVCRPGHGRHVTPDTKSYRHACDVWDSQGQQVGRAITALHKKGIW